MQTTKFAVAWAFIVFFFLFVFVLGALSTCVGGSLCRLMLFAIVIVCCVWMRVRNGHERQVNIRLSHWLLKSFYSRINTFSHHRSVSVTGMPYAFVTNTCALCSVRTISTEIGSRCPIFFSVIPKYAVPSKVVHTNLESHFITHERSWEYQNPSRSIFS